MREFFFVGICLYNSHQRMKMIMMDTLSERQSVAITNLVSSNNWASEETVISGAIVFLQDFLVSSDLSHITELCDIMIGDLCLVLSVLRSHQEHAVFKVVFICEGKQPLIFPFLIFLENPCHLRMASLPGRTAFRVITDIVLHLLSLKIQNEQLTTPLFRKPGVTVNTRRLPYTVFWTVYTYSVLTTSPPELK